MWATMAFHGFPEEFQRRFAVTALGHKAFDHLALVVHGPPKLVCLAVDLHENLVQMPLPMCPWPHPVHPSAADLSRKHRTEPVPPEPNGFVADLDAAFMQQILHIAERKRKPHIEHHVKANDLRGCLEVPKRTVFCHSETLRDRPARLKQVSPDSAKSPHVVSFTAKSGPTWDRPFFARAGGATGVKRRMEDGLRYAGVFMNSKKIITIPA